MSRLTIIIALVVLNCLVVFYAVCQLFVTLADVPMPVTLASTSPEEIAKAVGHAHHQGSQAMQNDAIKSSIGLTVAVFANFVTAVLFAFK